MKKEKKFLKVFIAGLTFPATILPFIYSFLFLSGNNAVINIPVQFIPHYLPIIFGLWNMLYFALGENNPIKNKNMRLWAWGALLGLIAALIGIFIIGLPELLYGLTGPLKYLPLIVVPVFYGLIWRYVVSSLNNLLGLEI